MYLVNFQSRVQVFIQWAIQNVTFSRGARLITGAAPTDFNFNEKVSEITHEPVNTHDDLLRSTSASATDDLRRAKV